eukprot:3474028-Rhodomonas_salina.1
MIGSTVRPVITAHRTPYATPVPDIAQQTGSTICRTWHTKVVDAYATSVPDIAQDSGRSIPSSSGRPLALVAS